MNRRRLPWVLVVVVLVATLKIQAANAVVDNCGEATRLEQSFSSGAAWAICVSVDEKHALELSSVHYRAPGDTMRSVLEQMHLGQILVHHHHETESRAQIVDDSQSRLLAMNNRTCEGSSMLDYRGNMTLCSHVRDNRILAKYAQRPAVHSQRWELFSALQRDGLVYTVSVSLTEDGQIVPAVSLSGRAPESLTNPSFSEALPASGQNLVRATVLVTWRMVFNLDNSDYDQVQQFDFPLNTTQNNTRPMQVSALDTEQFSNVDRGSFRGWRISDTSGSGYYLDPSNNGFSFGSREHNWTQFDLALTRYRPCERYALKNPSLYEGDARCGTNLDDFVSDEIMTDTHPVLWFSQSRTLHPSNEDWPAISNFYQSFTLFPHDWTSTSPFEVIQ
ncbi:MAG: hypothetical protein AB8B97_01285 [Granulosicoccus sp.]